MNYRPKPNPFDGLRNSPSSHNRGGLSYMTTMEREKQREKERQSRQQQVSENNVKDKKELFGSPVKVDDANDDEQSQLIQSQLGSFDDAKPYLDLVFSCGITGMPPSPAPPPPPSSSLSVAGMMQHHHSSTSSYPSSSSATVSAASAKSHHHAATAAAAAAVIGQQQSSSRRSVSPASGSGSVAPVVAASFKKPTVTSHAMARSSSSGGGGGSSSSAHFQPPANPPRSSNFLKPGEMKPPYSSMSRSTSSSMRSSHSSHHRPTHKPNLAISNVKNSHNSSNDTNTPSTIEDILNEMTVGLPLVSDIAETPRVSIVDSKYTADGKVEPQQRMSPKDASESLKKMLGETKQLFADPVHRNQQPSSHGVSPDVAASASAAAAAAAAAAAVPMDAKPSGPYNHSLFASYMVKPSVRGSNIMPQPQQTQLMQESQQSSLSPPTDKIRRSSTSTNVISSDSTNHSSTKADKTSSDMSVDEDSSSSEEGEKDSSSDSSCSDSESNDEKKDTVPPAAVSPPPQEEQEEEPKWYLKNFLKKSTPDTNNTTRTSQQEEPVGMSDPKSSPSFPTQRSEVVELLSEMSDSDSNHSEKQKSQSDSSSTSSSSSSSSEDEDDKKKKSRDTSCDSDSSYSSRSHALSKPITDLHKKYSALAKCEKKGLKNSFVKPAKLVERKSTQVIPKKEEPVEEPAAKKRGRKKGFTKTPKPLLPSKIKSKPLISSDTEDEEPPKPVKISEKRRGRPPGKKSKVISASSESEEWTDSSRKSRKKDSEKKSSHSVKKTPSWEKNQPQKPVARVSAALRPPRSISSSADSDSSDVECRPPPMSTATESPPKLDVEGIKVQDKKKNDTLRKLFITRREDGGAKSGGKSKGGKGGKGGVIIIDNNEAMRNDNERVISPVPVIPLMPKEPEGLKALKLSLMCKIPLSKLPSNIHHLAKSARSEELRTCADLANTRQDEKKQKHRHHKHHHKGSPSQTTSGSEKSKSNESPANTAPSSQPLLQQPSSDGYSKGMMDNVNVWRKPTSVCAVIPEAKVKPLEHSTISYLQRPAATSGLIHGPYEESSEDEDGGPPPFLPYSTTAVQIMDPRYKRSLELDQYSPNATKRRKFHNSTGSATLGRYSSGIGDGLINDILVDRMHEVPVQPPPRQPSWRMQSMHHQYPPRKRFFSYFVTDLYPENNMHQEVPLKEAQALTKLAEYEPDPITQEMKYLDGILCFVLSGHLMENDGTRERAVLKIYNDTVDLIKVIWSKIYNYRADCDHEELDEIFEMADNPERDNRLLILWMRCLSFLRLKLFKLLVYQNRQNFKTVQQHFLKNVGSSPISPSPSPASSVESHSSGYCSSSITPSGGAAPSGAGTGVIGVPIVVHNAIHSQHILYCHLAAAHEMWQRADLLVMRGKHTQFFVEMDRHCGPLTLHSTGHDLTLYARIAISRMRCEFNIKNYLP